MNIKKHIGGDRKPKGLRKTNSNFGLGINHYLNNLVETIHSLDIKNIEKFIELILETYKNDGNIYIFGNGGSGSTASHFCGDFMKGISYGLSKKFKVICLNDNIPSITAIANDISYEDIFIEQLKNFLKRKDLVIGISGSGNSANIIKALEFANKIGARTIAMCGFDGGKIRKIASLTIHAKINDMEISEDIHLILVHCIKRVIHQNLNRKTQFSEILQSLQLHK